MSEKIRINGESYAVPELKELAMDQITDPKWRINNLYKIINEDSELVDFKLRPIQETFLEDMWWRNLVLKSRQHGFSSLIDIWGLDKCIFHPNIHFVIIAHTKPDAEELMESKAIIPYINLHPLIKKMNPIIEENKTSIRFSNGSRMTATTSGRSGTAQILHVSELGYTSKHRPDAAKEIVTGSIPAVHNKGYVFVESTADGANGKFYELAQKAQSLKQMGKKLSQIDFKFHFYAWHEKPANVLSDDDTANAIITEYDDKYFAELKDKHDITLTSNQKAWYVSQKTFLGDEIKQEHPSTPKEAFESSTKGYFLADHLESARINGKIGKFPVQEGRVIHSFWDIGVDDRTSVWFMQKVGMEWNVVYYYEKQDKGLEWNIANVKEMAREKRWYLGEFIGPHDLNHRQKGSGVALVEEMRFASGIQFKVMNKVNSKIDSIQALRTRFGMLNFDEEGCAIGLERLAQYRKKYDKVHDVYTDAHVHDISSDAADALQQWALYEQRVEIETTRNSGAQPERQRPSLAVGGSQTGAQPEQRRRSKIRAYM